VCLGREKAVCVCVCVSEEGGAGERYVCASQHREERTRCACVCVSQGREGARRVS
jgi:hypothetical protein